ncbi:hypothetical protein [Algoriphagus terrigena]|uniref:hypothetical protein n=1 Tax=Algoriphagus terrigena TaxID=344884 RepID=UPI00047EDCEA|nr:hypothetical protein [Algoriphagus terrigena]
MTIIVGIVTKSSAVVASDGRISSGAVYEGEIQKSKSSVQSDEFDKTFSLKNGKLIGAISGTMRFQHKSTIEHIESLVQENSLIPYSLDELAKCICAGLKSGLLEVSNEEVLFRFRSIDLILIGPKSHFDLTYQMKSCRIKPNEASASIDYTIDTVDPVKDDHAHWQLFGDDNSQSMVNAFLKREVGLLTKRDEKTLRSISYKAIRHGIKYSTVSKSGDHQTCGGKVYVKNAT